MSKCDSSGRELQFFVELIPVKRIADARVWEKTGIYSWFGPHVNKNLTRKFAVENQVSLGRTRFGCAEGEAFGDGRQLFAAA